MNQRLAIVLLKACLCLSLLLMSWSASPAADPEAAGLDAWTSRLVKMGKLDSPLVEVTPFVFKGRFYMLENWQKQWETPESSASRHNEDEVRIRDMQSDKILSIPLMGHGLGSAFVEGDRVFVFAGDWGSGKKKWRIKHITMTISDDLEHWSKPVTALTANPDEQYFNVSVCRGQERFVMLVETNEPKWPPFTFKYFTSDDLRTWKRVPNAVYGTDKYVGGPALYHEGGYYYTLYLHSLGKGYYETRVTRSKDLVHWHDTPANRPFLTYNPDNLVHPIRSKTIHEANASDAELVYWQGKTRVYFTGGDQHYAGDLQWAQFDGTPRELLERFFR